MEVLGALCSVISDVASVVHEGLCHLPGRGHYSASWSDWSWAACQKIVPVRAASDIFDENKAMNFLKSLPYSMLIVATLFLGLAPFVPQPHLFEKIGMLFGGTLTRPIDIFDLAMHASPALLLLMKWLVERQAKP